MHTRKIKPNPKVENKNITKEEGRKKEKKIKKRKKMGGERKGAKRTRG